MRIEECHSRRVPLQHPAFGIWMNERHALGSWVGKLNSVLRERHGCGACGCTSIVDEALKLHQKHWTIHTKTQVAEALIRRQGKRAPFLYHPDFYGRLYHWPRM